MRSKTNCSHLALNQIWQSQPTLNPFFSPLILSLLATEAQHKGSKIHANIPKYAIKPANENPKLYGYYVVHMFSLKSNNGQYRPTDHASRIVFHKDTLFKPIEDLGYVHDDFNFVPFSDVLSRNIDQNILRDLIGEVVVYDTASLKTVDNALDFPLFDNSGNELMVRMWGQYGEAIYNHILTKARGNSFNLILRYVKIKEYRGMPTVQNGFDVTSLLIDPSIPVAIEFKQERLRNNGIKEEKLEETSTNTSKSEDWYLFEEHPISTLDDIIVLDKIGYFATLAKVIKFEGDNSWYYASCTECFRSVSKNDNNELHCTNCNKSIAVAKPRFRVPVRVKDGDSHDALFVLFDNAVRRWVGDSALNIREDQVRTKTTDFFPEKLADILFKYFIMIVNVKMEEDIKGNKVKVFFVGRMNSDSEKVGRFKDIMSSLISESERVVKHDGGEHSIDHSIEPLGLEFSTGSVETPNFTPQKRSFDQSTELDCQASVTKKLEVHSVDKGKAILVERDEP